MVRPRNQRQDLLPSKTKKCEALLKQTTQNPRKRLNSGLHNPGKLSH